MKVGKPESSSASVRQTGRVRGLSAFVMELTTLRCGNTLVLNELELLLFFVNLHVHDASRNTSAVPGNDGAQPGN